MAGTCVRGRHTECDTTRSRRFPLTVVPMGRVCGTGMAMECTQCSPDASNSAARSSTVSAKAFQAKSGS